MAMSRSSTLITIGLLTAIVAFAGVPLMWLRVLLPFFGVVLVVMGLIQRFEHVAAAKREASPEPTPHEPSPIA